MNPFSTEGFLKRGECGDWPVELLWTMNCSDLVVGMCFLGIALVMAYVLWQRKDVPIRWLWMTLAVTTFFCGSTHLVTVAMTWWPAWWIDALMRAVAAVLCLATLIGFLVSVRKVLTLISPIQVLDEQSGLTEEVSVLVEGLDKDRDRINESTRKCLDQVRMRLARIGGIRTELRKVEKTGDFTGPER